jgi:NACalpha-BTF3-like transcription factor
MADEEREEREMGPKVAADQAAAMNRLGGVGEGRELEKADTGKVKQAIQQIAEQQAASREAKRQHQRELAAVKVQQGDIDLLVAEFELDKRKAERHLRECKGDLKTALESLVDSPLL